MTTHPVAESQPAATKPVLDIHDILKILPHRYPMLLIDRVLELKRKKRIVAIKNVTVNEPFFCGHFPGLPIMPGVLIVEAMAQAGGALLLTEVEDRTGKLMVFTGIDRARFGSGRSVAAGSGADGMARGPEHDCRAHARGRLRGRTTRCRSDVVLPAHRQHSWTRLRRRGCGRRRIADAT